MVYRRKLDHQRQPSWRLIATLPANTRGCEDRDILGQETYAYRVVAGGEDGSSADSNVIEVPDPRPFTILAHEVEAVGEQFRVHLTVSTVSGSQYIIEISDDLIRWSPATLAHADDLFTGGLDQIFLGNFNGDTTTAVIEISNEAVRQFYRATRQ